MDCLSENGKKIAKQLFEEVHKPVHVIFSNENCCRMEYKDNQYFIHIAKMYGGSFEYEYFYLHELYHVYQSELQYPLLVCGDTNEEYQCIAAYFDSLINDINLDIFLEKRGIYIPKMLYQECANKLRSYFSNVQDTIDTIKGVTFYASQITIIYYSGNKDDVKDIINMIKDKQNYICQLVQYLISLIDKNNVCNSKEDLNKVFWSIKNDVLRWYGVETKYEVRNG